MSLTPPGDLLALADSILERAGIDQAAEVMIVDHQEALTRFARNQIHQNVEERSRRFRLRLVGEGRVGVAEIRGDGEDLPERLVAAADAARRLAPAGEVSPLPRPDAGSDGPVSHSPDTAGCTPEWRAAQVATVAAASAAAGLEAFGALQTSLTHSAVANSLGLRRHAESTTASVVCVTRGEGGWGYADRHHHDVGHLDVEAMAEEAIQTCRRNQGAVDIDPGVHAVVLSPYAVADLIGHLADLGFSAQAHQERRSFMRPGEALMSPMIGIADDASHPDSMQFPFDDEGVSTRAVTCIEEGVCRGFLHDSATALREDVPSTGHALPMPNTLGPWARHLVVSAGESSVDDLIARCERGLYVTRLWYVRDVHPLRTVITGMTRDGTFLIENGRLGAPVRDLRFTQSIVDALTDVRGVGRQRSIQLDEMERALLVPALCLGRFAFTS
jgi:predicted Zn-dependent protease